MRDKNQQPVSHAAMTCGTYIDRVYTSENISIEGGLKFTVRKHDKSKENFSQN